MNGNREDFMSDIQNDIELGVKTFFVVPELSLVPEEYLKSFFMKGFETYFLDDDPYYTLELKIHSLFSLFPEVIMFFNIDREIHGIEWPLFIDMLQKKYKDRAKIGVLYRKRNSQEEVRHLERLYLYDIGIVCGCIPIEYQKVKNLFILLNVLTANQANGQRKFIRAICDETCKINFEYRGNKYKGVIRDISISHFSCVFYGEIPDVLLHEKITDIQISLKGTICKIDGVCCLKRYLGNEQIHVFVFRNVNDREGLNPEHLLKVNSFVYSLFYMSVNLMLKNEYDQGRYKAVKSDRRQAASPMVIKKTVA